MSKFREKSEYMAMRVSGFLGWIHRLVMLITFPIRKFWMIVTVLAVVLIILIAIPMFYGIQLRDVWDWYMIKMPNHEFVEAKDKTLFGAKEQVDKLRRTFNDIVPNKKEDDASKKQTAQKKTRLVSWHVAEFKKAKYKPRPATPIIEKVTDVKDKIIETVKPAPAVVEETKPVENVVVTENHYVADVHVPARVENKDEVYKLDDETDNTVTDSEYEPSEDYEPESEPDEEYEPEEKYEPEEEAESEPEEEPEEDAPLDIEDYYTKVNSSDLTYLTPPQIYEGVVKVIGPNSIYVNGKFLFLYGIYTNPRQHDVKAATDYLRNLSEGNQAYCFAVARSRKTHSNTALCFVEGTLINRALVEHNFAKNVALK